MNSLELSILKTVAYFDVFKYPVSRNEIGYFLDQKYDEKALSKALNNLLSHEVLFQLGNFYALSNDANLVERRIEGNNAATDELRKAKKASAFLYRWFPFINGIGISGSLSKNVAYKDSDFDFFIITAENRLWIARTIFIFFYRVACLVGLKRMFCLNYLIDEKMLEIEEKNIFTAIEISTLLVCDGKDVYEKFFKANQWVENIMPNYSPRFSEERFIKPAVFRRIIERLFNNEFGNKTNEKILKFYQRRWQKLSAKNIFTPKGFQLGGMVVTSHICKPLPQHFQQKILNYFTERFENAKKTMSEKLYFKTERQLNATS